MDSDRTPIPAATLHAAAGPVPPVPAPPPVSVGQPVARVDFFRRTPGGGTVYAQPVNLDEARKVATKLDAIINEASAVLVGDGKCTAQGLVEQAKQIVRWHGERHGLIQRLIKLTFTQRAEIKHLRAENNVLTAEVIRLHAAPTESAECDCQYDEDTGAVNRHCLAHKDQP